MALAARAGALLDVVETARHATLRHFVFPNSLALMSHRFPVEIGFVDHTRQYTVC